MEGIEIEGFWVGVVERVLDGFDVCSLGSGGRKVIIWDGEYGGV